MCMKNINVNVVFADIQSNQEDGNISLLNIGKPFRCLCDNGTRKIPQLSATVFVAATQSKDQEIVKTYNPGKVFVFSEKYELKIRLAETVSGVFKDLGHFEIDPEKGDVSEGICRHTFNYTHLGIYQDISLPDQGEREKFVIKILIRRKIENRTADGGWVVQSVVPVNLI